MPLTPAGLPTSSASTHVCAAAAAASPSPPLVPCWIALPLLPAAARAAAGRCFWLPPLSTFDEGGQRTQSAEPLRSFHTAFDGSELPPSAATISRRPPMPPHRPPAWQRVSEKRWLGVAASASDSDGARPACQSPKRQWTLVPSGKGGAFSGRGSRIAAIGTVSCAPSSVSTMHRAAPSLQRTMPREYTPSASASAPSAAALSAAT